MICQISTYIYSTLRKPKIYIKSRNMANRVEAEPTSMTGEEVRADDIAELRKKVQTGDLKFDSAVFGGGGAKVMAYVGAVEVYEIISIIDL